MTLARAKQIIKNRLRILFTAKKESDSYRIRKEYANLSTRQIFTKIYEEGVWGKSSEENDKYFSGGGSHENTVVTPYVEAIRKTLALFDNRPNVVDLGCGDFHIGAQIRGLCGAYAACDIVDSVIAFDREKFGNLDVDFSVIDLTTDILPGGDIVFIRQVLQHLSNDQIIKALPRIASTYKYLILTEHLPAAKTFIANLDKPTGPDNRLGQNSGIVLTKPPFNLAVKEEKVICETMEGGGVIRTWLYRLA
jgi:hypothetical protein